MSANENTNCRKNPEPFTLPDIPTNSAAIPDADKLTQILHHLNHLKAQQQTDTQRILQKLEESEKCHRQQIADLQCKLAEVKELFLRNQPTREGGADDNWGSLLTDESESISIGTGEGGENSENDRNANSENVCGSPVKEEAKEEAQEQKQEISPPPAMAG